MVTFAQKLRALPRNKPWHEDMKAKSLFGNWFQEASASRQGNEVEKASLYGIVNMQMGNRYCEGSFWEATENIPQSNLT